MLRGDCIIEVEVKRSHVGIVIHHAHQEPERDTPPDILSFGPENLVSGLGAGQA